MTDLSYGLDEWKKKNFGVSFTKKTKKETDEDNEDTETEDDEVETEENIEIYSRSASV